MHAEDGMDIRFLNRYTCIIAAFCCMLTCMRLLYNSQSLQRLSIRIFDDLERHCLAPYSAHWY